MVTSLAKLNAYGNVHEMTRNIAISNTTSVGQIPINKELVCSLYKQMW